jgi:phosphomannomutase / phosphoglucomutase
LINPHIFREYDIRGVADRDLTDETALAVARAFGSRVREAGGRTVVLGRDVRASSQRLEDAWTRGLVSTGLSVWRVGMVPTPVVYYAVSVWPADAGVMITGSHNPIEFNGFKLQIGPASLHGEEIQDLRRRIGEGIFAEGRGDVSDREVLDAYRAMVVERCQSVRPLRLVIDAGNGTAGPVAGPILESLGHAVTRLYCDPDPRFPNHLPDPTVPAFMHDLARRVTEERADLGFGYDGDADRLGVVDETGRLLYGDQLLALFARDVLERMPGAPIVFDVKCSQGLEEDIRAHGGRPVMWKSGHSLTKAKMREEGAPVAGEMSGHMFFAENFWGHDDGIYGSARFAALLARWGGPLSRHVGDLPPYENSPEIRVECPDEAKFRVVEDLAREFARTHDVLTLDGARVRFEDGWGLVRASNTQPVLVLRFEGRTPAALRAVEAAFRAAMARHPEVRWTAEGGETG